jgi:hypothetical protein
MRDRLDELAGDAFSLVEVRVHDGLRSGTVTGFVARFNLETQPGRRRNPLRRGAFCRIDECSAESGMARKKKNLIPKKLAGFKVPKRVRKSRVLKSLISSPLGRDILANALTAGAGAAAAVLVNHRDEVEDATEKGARRGARTLALLSEAVSHGSSAALGVVTDAAQGFAADEKRNRPDGPGKKARPGTAANVRH